LLEHCGEVNEGRMIIVQGKYLIRGEVSFIAVEVSNNRCSWRWDRVAREDG
jgi:hypothetical protein